MAFSADFLPSDEVAEAIAQRFGTLDLGELRSSRIAMRDPQQPLGGGVAERIVLEDIQRPLHGIELGGDAEQPAGPDPAEVARELIAEARTTARTMLAQARDVIAAEREQARQQGYEEGFARGTAEADEEAAGLIATCEKIGVHVMEERERVLAENEADLVELAISIARRIVNAAIDVDETIVLEACRGAMRKAFQRGALQVRANPADLALLREAGPKLAEELGGIEQLEFIEERRLDRGSVLVQTAAGEIDATIAGKAAKIEQALREGIEQRRGERSRD